MNVDLARPHNEREIEKECRRLWNQVSEDDRQDWAERFDDYDRHPWPIVSPDEIFGPEIVLKKRDPDEPEVSEAYQTKVLHFAKQYPVADSENACVAAFLGPRLANIVFDPRLPITKLRKDLEDAIWHLHHEYRTVILSRQENVQQQISVRPFPLKPRLTDKPDRIPRDIELPNKGVRKVRSPILNEALCYYHTMARTPQPDIAAAVFGDAAAIDKVDNALQTFVRHIDHLPSRHRSDNSE